MENIDDNLAYETGLLNNATINQYLTSAAKWAKFLAIVGFIGLGLMVIAAFVVMAATSRLSAYDSPFPGMTIGFLYLIFSVVYFFPVYYLLLFANRTNEALVHGDATNTEEAFFNLKRMFKFMGIMTIVILSLYVLAIVIGIFAGMVASSGF